MPRNRPPLLNVIVNPADRRRFEDILDEFRFDFEVGHDRLGIWYDITAPEKEDFQELINYAHKKRIRLHQVRIKEAHRLDTTKRQSLSEAVKKAITERMATSETGVKPLDLADKLVNPKKKESKKKDHKHEYDNDQEYQRNFNEEEMTDAQKKKREEIVLSMKKDKADLQKRYGDDWESAMYAIATKQAMKE